MFLCNLLCVLKHAYIGTLFDEINYGLYHTKVRNFFLDKIHINYVLFVVNFNNILNLYYGSFHQVFIQFSTHVFLVYTVTYLQNVALTTELLTTAL